MDISLRQNRAFNLNTGQSAAPHLMWRLMKALLSRPLFAALTSYLSCTTGVQKSYPPGMERLDRAGPALERASEGLIPRLGGGDAAHNVLAVAHIEIEMGEKFLFGQRVRGIDTEVRRRPG
jgi:hypothetical protein